MKPTAARRKLACDLGATPILESTETVELPVVKGS
jgi:hypothetical protein